MITERRWCRARKSGNGSLSGWHNVCFRPVADIGSRWHSRDTFKCEDSPGWRSAGARYRWDWAPTRGRPPTRRNWNRP